MEARGSGQVPADGATETDQASLVPEAQHAAWFELLRVHARVNEGIEQRLSQAQQIPLHWYDVLLALEKAPERRLRISELADNVLTSRSNLSHLVKRLEGEGLLGRERCPDDGRGSYVVLTDAGSQARLGGWPAVSQGIVELFASKISDEEADLIARILRRVMQGENNPVMITNHSGG